MLGFVQNIFAPRANPIGVDFGSDTLRLAQVQQVGDEPRLIAAASADVPSHVKHDFSARLEFFTETTRDLLSQGGFRGRQAILALPASIMHVQHLRMAKMGEAETKKALPWEARGKLPIEPSQALLRHVVAGEVYQEQDPKNEVIVIAAQRQLIEQFLAAASKAKLDVVGMNVEQKCLIDCFAHVYRRKTDTEATSALIDIGSAGTRVVIARENQILFARVIPIGGEHFARAVAQALRIPLDQAKVLRIKHSAASAPFDDRRDKSEIHGPESSEPAMSMPLLDAGLQASVAGVGVLPAAQPIDEAQRVEQACQEQIERLADELDICRRYYESTFPNRPVDRLIFVGGEARQRGMCQQIARQLHLAAQVGDPLVRMGRVSTIGPESGIDRRHPQPGWAVAIGLSLGPVAVEKPAETRS